MSNRIKVKRGSDTARQSATLQEGEIHYSTGNASGAGRPERLWISDSSAASANSGDLLVGPFEFVSGDSRITVATDYQTGKVTIGYLDAASWNPSQTLTAVASTYSNNATIEAGDTFGGPHTLTVTTGGGANEVKIDRAGYTQGANTAYFASPLNAIDGNVLASGSATLSYATSFPTPSAFKLSDLGTRRIKIRVFCDPPTASGQSQDASDLYFNYGWRVRGFISTDLYNPSNLPTPTQIVSTSGANRSQFNVIQQTPTSAATRSYVLPNDGQQWHCYLVHSCSPDATGDLFGWTPSATVVGSGAISLTEVTDLVNADIVSVGSSGTNLGGQPTNKYYRIWRFGGTSGYFGDGSTLQFSIS
jgi:hypothetical protein